MCVSFSSNVVSPCKTCNIPTENKGSAAECNICQFLIKLNHTDCKYFQGSKIIGTAFHVVMKSLHVKH